MLLRFGVGNYRSIRDYQELSFVATGFNQHTAVTVRVQPEGSLRVLPAIGVYGSNASGKSNALQALTELAALVSEAGLLGQGAESLLDHDPFALNPATRDQPTRYEVELLLGGVRYVYGLSHTGAAITGEWLHAYPHGRRQVWFERLAEAPDEFRFPGEHLRGSKNILAAMVRPDMPFLALGQVVRHGQLSPVALWFRGVHRTGPVSRGFALRPAQRSLVRLLTGPRAEAVLNALARADFGVDGVEIVDDVERPARKEIRLRHRGPGGSTALPLQAESAGTLSWLWTLRSLLDVMDQGGVLVVDELDASLHPELVAETIRMFYDRRLNSHHAQLLFASHNVSMLRAEFGSPLLDRDQVWFTEKGEDGATELYPLTDLKPRKGENIERGYLTGRYGAVPGLSPGELGRAFWTNLDEDAA